MRCTRLPQARLLRSGITRYVDRLYEIEHADKSPYSHVDWESSVERDFAERLDMDDRVRFFVKLPSWFAKRHFAALGADYAVTTSFDDLIAQVST